MVKSMLEEENKKSKLINELDEDLLELENIVNNLSKEVEMLESSNRRKEVILDKLYKIADKNEIE